MGAGVHGIGRLPGGLRFTRAAGAEGEKRQKKERGLRGNGVSFGAFSLSLRHSPARYIVSAAAKKEQPKKGLDLRGVGAFLGCSFVFFAALLIVRKFRLLPPPAAAHGHFVSLRSACGGWRLLGKAFFFAFSA